MCHQGEGTRLQERLGFRTRMPPDHAGRSVQPSLAQSSRPAKGRACLGRHGPSSAFHKTTCETIVLIGVYHRSRGALSCSTAWPPPVWSAGPYQFPTPPSPSTKRPATVGVPKHSACFGSSLSRPRQAPGPSTRATLASRNVVATKAPIRPRTTTTSQEVESFDAPAFPGGLDTATFLDGAGDGEHGEKTGDDRNAEQGVVARDLTERLAACCGDARRVRFAVMGVLVHGGPAKDRTGPRPAHKRLRIKGREGERPAIVKKHGPLRSGPGFWLCCRLYAVASLRFFFGRFSRSAFMIPL